MHFYPFHVGDYVRDTAHLSDREDLLYRRMIDLYYLNDGPLPDDVSAIARRIRAREEGDVELVRQLLVEFFDRDGSGAGWRNSRCDWEIETYQGQVEAGRRGGKASAAKRAAKAVATPPSREGSTPPSTGGSGEGATNQEPRTNKEEKKKTLSGKPDVAVFGELLEYLNTTAGKKFRCNESNLQLLRARLSEGFAPADVRAVIDAKVAEWADDPKMSQYLRPATLFNRTKFSQYHGNLSSRPADRPPEDPPVDLTPEARRVWDEWKLHLLAHDYRPPDWRRHLESFCAQREAA